MRALISTWPRRLALSTVVTVLAFACSFVYAQWTVDQGADITGLFLLRHLVLWPLSVGLVAFLILTRVNVLLNLPEASPAAPSRPLLPMENALPAPKVVQVLGLQWLSPVHRGDYPTQWHLLWAQGLAQPNPDDPRLAENDGAFDKVDVSRPVIVEQDVPIAAFEHYLGELLDRLRDGYRSDPSALYTVCAPQPAQRRSLDGIFVSCAVPDTVNPVAARELVIERVSQAFGLDKAQPVVHVHAGGAEAGAAALKLAQDYLRSCPDCSAWLLSWDAPDLPTPTPSENLVLAVLAGAEFEGGRHPLAWLGEQATVKPSVQAPDGELPATVKLWSTAVHAAVANVDHDGVGHVVHDTTNSGEGIGGLVPALGEALPGFGIHRGGFDASQTFGSTGACAVPLSIALAVARVEHFSGCAAVTVALPDEHGVAAVAVKAPVGDALPTKGTWFRADTEDFAYLPWWGRRLTDSSRQSVLGLPT